MAAAVDPSQAQGAQISIQSFKLPDFPSEARALKALTLTSDINVEQYQSILKQDFSIPSTIPHGIESLTLELFSLGYPPGFLQHLADRLPNLKSVIIYSQLFPGLSAQSQNDAVLFLKKLPSIRALHLLDVFARPGSKLGLEVNGIQYFADRSEYLYFTERTYTIADLLIAKAT